MLRQPALDNLEIKIFEAVYGQPFSLENVVEVIRPGVMVGSSRYFQVKWLGSGITGPVYRKLPEHYRVAGSQKHTGRDKVLNKVLHNVLTDFPAYGIIDSPQQFIDKYLYLVARSHEPLAVFFHYGGKPGSVEKVWRWHKQGRYFGNQGKPTCEYFDDEPGFQNGVYFFTIMQVMREEEN